MKTKFLLLALLATTFFSSCKKDKPEPADPLANAHELLQNKNWKLTELTVTPAINGSTNVLDIWDECDTDDIFLFLPANLFVLNGGGNLCDPEDPQDESGTWSYNEPTHLLTFQLQPVGDLYAIELTAVNDNTMTARETEVFNGVNYTYNWVFTKQ